MASSRLTYPAAVPSGVREDLEIRIAASLEQITEANATDVLCDVLWAVIGTIEPIARQEPAWWAARWPGMMHAWIRELSEASRLRLLGYQVFVLSDRIPTPPDAIDRETFHRRVSDAVRVSPAGTRSEQLQCELAEPPRNTASAATRGPNPLEIARRQAARECVVSWLDELDWTPTKWATESGVDPSVTLGYLAGTSNPRTVSRERLRDALATALKRPIQLPD